MKTKLRARGSVQHPNKDVPGVSHKEDAPPIAAPSITKILVPIDFSASSGTALEYAVRLGTELAAKIVLLHVVEGASCTQDFPALEGEGKEAHQNVLESQHYRLCEFLRKRVPQRCHVELLVRMGRATSEIPDTAQALGADLIVLGAKGQSPLNHLFLGSTAERVLGHAHCPVLTVRHQQR